MILTSLVVHKVNLQGTMFVHLLRTLHACMCIRYEERTFVAMEVPILLVVRFLTQHWMLPQE